jgi:hypothetical protein
MPEAGSCARLCFGAALLAAPLSASAAESDPGYVWMNGVDDGNALLTYGSAETGEDYVFSLFCNNRDKDAAMTVYVDIAGTEVGQPLTIELGAGSAKVSVKGEVATDEMSGFHFAEAKDFKVKPLIALFKEMGPAMAETGKLVTTLPEKGRATALAEFEKGCQLP